MTAYESLRRWESRAPGAPTLRGRLAAGRKPTLHWLSGNGFSGGVYWPFLRALHMAGHGLLTQDIEGQGDSDAPPRFSGVATLLKRTAQVIRERGLDAGGTAPVGIGHSFGAALTLRVAAANPGLFRALVLLDPIAMPTPVWLVARAWALTGRYPIAAAARRRRDRWPSREAADRHLRGRGIYAGWTAEAFDCFMAHATRDERGERVLSCPRELEAEIFEHPLYCWRAFRQVQTPILFLRGAGSYPFFPAAERRAAAGNRGVELAQLPGGHCFMQENPEAAADVVLRFLERHAPGGGGAAPAPAPAAEVSVG